MTILEVLIMCAAALLWGAVMRERSRVHFLMAASVLVMFWLQPALPLRGYDFWIPLATLLLIVMGWFFTAEEEARREKNTWTTLAFLTGVVLLIALTRYLPIDTFLTPSRPPQIQMVAMVLAVAGLILLLPARLKLNSAVWWTAFGILLVALFFIIKVPALAYWASYGLRALGGQSIDTARSTDLRWLGFSYVAFRVLHTVRDRQMGRLPAVTLAEYISYGIFFPSFTAGPIDRIERFIKDLRKSFVPASDEYLAAGQRLILGLFKKFVIADTLALIALNDTNALQIRTAGWAWILLYAYAFQIYFDFSGYTDIAIGTARLLGIQLPENFSAPYLKPNLTQFWNNWHMTLTQWFRAYFFNPVTRWVRSWEKPMPAPLMIALTQVTTMLLIGFWHGVTWNFTLWGLWHGAGLFLHNRWNDYSKVRATEWADTPLRKAILNISGLIATFHFVAIGWVFFTLSEPSAAFHVLAVLLGQK